MSDGTEKTNGLPDTLDGRKTRLHGAIKHRRLEEAALMDQSDTHKRYKKLKQEWYFVYAIREFGRLVGAVTKMWRRAIGSVLFGATSNPTQLWQAFYFGALTTIVLSSAYVMCMIARLPLPWTRMLQALQRAAVRFAVVTAVFFAPVGDLITAVWDSKLVLAIRHSLIAKALTHSIFGLWVARVYDKYWWPPKLILRIWYDLRDAEIPMTMYDQLYEDQADAAKASLSQPMAEAASQYGGERVFDLDAAKILMQMSALMYEDNTMSVGDAAPDAFEDVMHAKSHIPQFCRKWTLEYEPVTRLNSPLLGSPSFCSVFWDKTSNWIVLAFKGTGPTDFNEIATDLDYGLIPSGSWLDGFHKVHEGFSDRIFPRSMRGLKGKRPYDTIAATVKELAGELIKNNKGKINVWFTGHSLGTAIASLTYARAIGAKHHFGRDCVIRDAYVFATPIITDVPSVQAFNYTMFRNAEQVRTMWRITNRNDAVATALPEGGDRPDCINPDNPFAFAHLGTELTMKDKQGHRVDVAGNHITEGLPVLIRSKFSDEELYNQRIRGLTNAHGGTPLAPIQLEADWKLAIPGFGNLLAHGWDPYWNSLAKLTNGEGRWVDD